MGKVGIISAIKKDYPGNGILTMQGELSKRGMTRVPGTGVFKYIYKELDNRYRTGLDPEANYIKRIQDKTARDLEIKRVTETYERLTKSFGGIDLSPYSSFWNYSLAKSTDDTTHYQPYKLMDGNNYFDLSIPFQELAYSWLRVHPTIASSYQAWINGEYPAETQFYVVDEDIETSIEFKKNKAINIAIGKLDSMIPDKRKKVARLLGLPVTDDSTEELVYNQIDKVLKQSTFQSGKFQGLSPIEVFTRFADLKDGLLHVKDLVKQALLLSIYRTRTNGRIYEGELEIAKDEDQLVEFLMDDDHQEDLIMLEQKVKAKKIAAL